MAHQGLERDFAQMNIHIQSSARKQPPAVAPKPKIHNSAPAPYRPGGGQYRQFRDQPGESEFPPPPPQSGYHDEQFPPPPQDSAYEYESRETREEFPPPPTQSTSYTYSRDSPDMTNYPGGYTSSYSSQPNTFENQTYGTTSYTSQNTSPRSYDTQTYSASPRTVEDEYTRAKMYQHESKQSPYTVRSTSPAGRTSPYTASNYANISSLQSSYSNEPTSQEPSPYARPVKVTTGRQYSPTPQDGYVRVGSGGSQGRPSPTPQHDMSYSAGPGSASPRGQVSPHYKTEVPSERPVPGPQVPASYIDDDLLSPTENKGSNKEAEVDALTNLLLQNMESTSDPDFYGMCSKCGKKVMGESNGCTAMDQIFHIACFICINCGTMLRGKSFYSMDNKPYCEPCYMNSLEKCSVCSKPITDRLLRATGKPYHPACFVCVVCGKSLDGIPFTVDATNQIHCIEDFHSKFAPRCCVCQTPIVPEPGQEETVRVVAMDRSFHVHCYRCEDCGLQLSSEADGRGCYPLDEHILCKTCNAKRIQMMTTKMATEL